MRLIPERFLVIDISQRESTCIACDRPLVGPRHGLPMFEGRVVPVSWAGEWGGFDCCESCFEAYTKHGPPGIELRLRTLREARGTEAPCD